jgi:hypothetical protein
MLHATVIRRVRNPCLASLILKAVDHRVTKRAIVRAQLRSQNRDHIAQGVNPFPLSGNAIKRFHGWLS